jgi:hypothetical protein
MSGGGVMSGIGGMMAHGMAFGAGRWYMDVFSIN